MNTKALRQKILDLAIHGKLVPPACRQAGKSLENIPAEKEGQWFVYVIECVDGSFYKGFTTDLIKRYKQHCAGIGAEWTKTHKPKQLFYWEIHYSEKSAIEREKYLKSGCGREWFKNEVVDKPENWESATDLLEKIRAEKAAKIKKGLPAGRCGELKADKKDSFIFVGSDKRHYEQFADGTVKDIEDEIPFEVPEGWAWCRLKEVCTVFGRIGFRGYTRDDLVEKGNGAITLSPSNLINMKLDLTDCTYISWPKYEESPEIQLDINDIVVVKTGSSYGKTSLVDNLTEKTTLNPQLMVLKERKCNSKYLCYFLNTQYMRKHFEDLVNGTAIPTFSQEKFGMKLFPLPPASEQEKIVESIEESFSQIDILDNEKSDLQTAINKTKSKILDLAIHGKLVPQDPNDEPAEELLKRIATSDNRPYEKVEEEPFEIPDSWRWVKLNDLAEIARGGSPRPIQDYITEDKDGINWIKIGDTIEESKYITSAKEKIKPEGKKHSRFVHAGDFLLTNSMSFGRPYILKIDGCIHDGWLVFANIKECLLQDYLYYALSSAYIYETFSNVAAGSTVKNLKSDTVKQVDFPLPPLSEQKRIVEAIENMYEILDQIQNNLV